MESLSVLMTNASLQVLKGGGLNCFLYLWYQVDISERFSGQWGFVVELISKVEKAT